MSIFEFFGEARNPGPLGGIDSPAPDRPPGRAAIPRAVIGALAVGVGVVLLWQNASGPYLFLGLMFSAMYLITAFVVRPEPDYSNVGWLGGLIDHPFRYSDDINRLLIVLLIILWPGRFISDGLVDGWRVIRPPGS